MSQRTQPITRPRWTAFRITQLVLAALFLAFLIWRLYTVLVIQGVFGLDTWLRFLIFGLIIGSVYALIAIGYTLVYGILFMINFAHGEIMMLGGFAGYFTLEALTFIKGSDGVTFLNQQPVISVALAFIAGMLVSLVSGILLERIAYRPLRGAPRLVPLISAIGASIFLQNMAQLMFGANRRAYTNPDILQRGIGWTITVNERPVIITYTGAFTFILSIVLLIGLYTLVQRTRMGRAMRAVAENKEVASLMGIDIDAVIMRTFAISGAMAGAAGVVWGLHNGIIYHFIGFIPGLKAFTAAVLGGIGNLPGAMIGGLTLGLVESIGPAVLGFDFQLKDVIAFSILVLVLVFRPSGILGEVLTEEKV
ncbi:MAG: branched-chain amino acid ABC transporter permease [Anaerolineales bacterium]